MQASRHKCPFATKYSAATMTKDPPLSGWRAQDGCDEPCCHWTAYLDVTGADATKLRCSTFVGDSWPTSQLAQVPHETKLNYGGLSHMHTELRGAGRGTDSCVGLHGTSNVHVTIDPRHHSAFYFERRRDSTTSRRVSGLSKDNFARANPYNARNLSLVGASLAHLVAIAAPRPNRPVELACAVSLTTFHLAGQSQAYEVSSKVWCRKLVTATCPELR